MKLATNKACMNINSSSMFYVLKLCTGVMVLSVAGTGIRDRGKNRLYETVLMEAFHITQELRPIASIVLNPVPDPVTVLVLISVIQP